MGRGIKLSVEMKKGDLKERAVRVITVSQQK